MGTVYTKKIHFHKNFGGKKEISKDKFYNLPLQMEHYYYFHQLTLLYQLKVTGIPNRYWERYVEIHLEQENHLVC